MNKPTTISDTTFPSTSWESISQGFTTCISDRDKRIQELEAQLGITNTPITDESRLLRAYKLGQELSAICRELKGNLPEQFDDAIDLNIDSLHDILNNFAGIRIHVFMENRKCKTSAS